MSELDINRISNRHLKNIIDVFLIAKEFKTNNPDFLQFWEFSNKADNPVTNAKNIIYDPITTILSRNYSDREFPLETVELQSFNQEHGKKIDSAIIHVGYSSNEIALHNNFLAFVMMDHIFFRSNKFNTTTEEGRKLLRHELTHVAQNKEKDFRTTDELEREAEMAEYVETVESDPAETVTIDGKYYQLKKSEQRKIICQTAEYITNWVEEQKYLNDEEDYLKILINYEKMLKSINTLYDVKTEADRWMEQELKRELRSMSGI